MRSNALHFAFYALALVLCGATEELLPKCLGLGFPVLFALSGSATIRKPAVVMVLVAFAAGAFEDALSSLPMMASPCFFLVASVCAWRTHSPKIVFALAYPLYQIWLKLIVPDLLGSLGTRFFVAIPAGALSVFLLFPLFAWLERKAAVNES